MRNSPFLPTLQLPSDVSATESSVVSQSQLYGKLSPPWPAHSHQFDHSPFEEPGAVTPYNTARISTSLHGSINSAPAVRLSFEDKLNRIFDHDSLGGSTVVKDSSAENENGQSHHHGKYEENDVQFQQDKENFDDDDEVYSMTLAEKTLDEVVSIIFDEQLKGLAPKRKNKGFTLLVLVLLIIVSMFSSIFSALPITTCSSRSFNNICLPQVSIQLTDSAPASKSALATVRELFKVLSYLALDFGDTKGEIDYLNTKFEDYYKNNVIDTFSEDTIYRLNYWGYCRMSTRDSDYFCMSSCGFDLLGVLVRDAGVQLAELTGTNVEIMGDSFAMTYEFAVSGFNQLINRDTNGSGDDSTGSMLEYAILLQKFSKGAACLVMIQHVCNCLQLLCALILGVLMFLDIDRKNVGDWKKKYTVVSMTVFSFVSVFVGLLVCSLTYQYVLKITELAQNAGIAHVMFDSGYSMIWGNFGLEVVGCCLVVYMANAYRKRVL